MNAIFKKCSDYLIGLKDPDDFQFDVFRFIGLTLIAAITVSIFYSVFFWFVEFWFGAGIVAAAVPPLSLALFAVRKRMPISIVVNILNLVVTTVCIVLAFFSGGIHSPVVYWLVLPVFFAFWSFGPFLGVYWGISGLFIAGILFALNRSGAIKDSEIMENSNGLIEFCSYSVFLIVNVGLSWVLFRQRKRAVEVRDELISGRQNMIQTMAHDLKNPVAGIVSRIYLMERRKSDGIEVDELEVLDAIKKDATGILGHIDQMLLLNRSKAVQKAPEMHAVDLRAIIDAASKMHMHWMEAKGVTLDASSIIATRVDGDRALLIRLFENIISNAIKYSHSQSKIECSVRETSDQMDSVIVEIRDRGLGMDPKEATHFFSLEYRPNRPTAGESSSGVGASLMREIVQAHNGKIWLQSQGREQGTTVFVQLKKSA